MTALVASSPILSEHMLRTWLGLGVGLGSGSGSELGLGLGLGLADLTLTILGPFSRTTAASAPST
jgi:hypothetical protein